MRKLISLTIVLFLFLAPTYSFGAKKKYSTKKSYTKSAASLSKKKSKVRVSRYNKKYRRSYRFKRGNGPDLKEITKNSPFEVIPDNGKTIIE